MNRDRLDRLRERAQADRWKVPPEVFSNALERSAEKAFAGRTPSESDLDRYYGSLHLSDLALACACAMGREDAWDHFVREFRAGMYRAADAMDPAGGAREIAEALYAELFGLKEKDGIRQSVFRYFHGRSSLGTWLRSLVAQRFIDRHRETRRFDPLPDERSAAPLRATQPSIDPDRARFVAAMRAVLAAAIAALEPRDRLRLACYYAQDMTLAQIGTLTREHEATVSRHLARTRKAIREDVEKRLRDDKGFAKAEIDECFASIVDDAGNLDLGEWLDTDRKKPGLDRSLSRELS
ncbi:MAG: sigma-70 family RNA polymerase sigma factor [Cyanobacteria bacterium]|nr:sigma-70 family RNA polymerase sigma factor [Cyanobacteriota bacterium]